MSFISFFIFAIEQNGSLFFQAEAFYMISLFDDAFSQHLSFIGTSSAHIELKNCVWNESFNA